MAHNSDDKDGFLKHLAEIPSVGGAAKKVGISRATIYRWRKAIPSFRKQMDAAESSGRLNMVDNLEMTAYKKAMQGDVRLIQFLLTHNSERYSPKQKAMPAPTISQEDMDLYRLIGDILRRNQPIPADLHVALNRSFQAHGYMDANGKLTDKFKAENKAAINYYQKQFGTPKKLKS